LKGADQTERTATLRHVRILVTVTDRSGDRDRFASV
jgi:hypothetical protein